MPKRVQMHRRKGGWRKDHPDAVIVARPSKWGNQFVIGERTLTRNGGYALIKDAAMAVELFRARWTQWRGSYSAELIRELRGKDLACWCPLDQPCHADVLLELANRPLMGIPSQHDEAVDE